MLIVPPSKLAWKEFESTILYRLEGEEKFGRATGSRYGVQGVYMRKQGSPKPEWTPIKSNPDINGVTDDAWLFIIEAKVCSGSKLALIESKVTERQIKFMIRHSKFQVTCMLMIHWNERLLKTKSFAAATYALPVHYEHPFWLAFQRGEIKSLNRDYCEKYAVPVPWDILDGQRKESPNVLFAINVLREVTDMAVAEAPTPEAPKVTKVTKEPKKSKPAPTVKSMAKSVPSPVRNVPVPAKAWKHLFDEDETTNGEADRTAKPTTSKEGTTATPRGSSDQRHHPF